MTAITDTKLRDILMKKKKPELKKTLEIIKQNTYERKNRKNTIPEVRITSPEKEKKRRTNVKNEKIRYKTEKQNNNRKTM